MTRVIIKRGSHPLNLDIAPVLQQMCLSRGLILDRINPEEDLLLPVSSSREDLRRFSGLMEHYAVRLLLRETIKADRVESWRRGRRAVERFCSPEAVDGYLARLREIGALKDAEDGRPVPAHPVKSFGSTYEWYVAQVLSSDFASESAWGVRFGGMEAGGDHDVISSLSGRFLYVEVKTGPPKHVEQPEASAFIRRVYDLAPDIAIFHNDTHLRMKDKIVPLLEEGVRCFRRTGSDRRCSPAVRGNKDNGGAGLFQRMEREIFHWNSSVFVVNSKPDLKRNLASVFRHFFRSENRILRHLR